MTPEELKVEDESIRFIKGCCWASIGGFAIWLIVAAAIAIYLAHK